MNLLNWNEVQESIGHYNFNVLFPNHKPEATPVKPTKSPVVLFVTSHDKEGLMYTVTALRIGGRLAGQASTLYFSRSMDASMSVLTEVSDILFRFGDRVDISTLFKVEYQKHYGENEPDEISDLIKALRLIPKDSGLWIVNGRTSLLCRSIVDVNSLYETMLCVRSDMQKHAIEEWCATYGVAFWDDRDNGRYVYISSQTKRDIAEYIASFRDGLVDDMGFEVNEPGGNLCWCTPSGDPIYPLSSPFIVISHEESHFKIGATVVVGKAGQCHPQIEFSHPIPIPKQIFG